MSSDLKNKMSQWETQPPLEAWNKIAASLDADEEYILAKKLNAFESRPPKHNWELIEAELNAHEPGRVIPFYQRHKQVLRYASAAAALIFVAVMISLFVTQGTASNELTQQSGLQSIPGTRKSQPPANKEVQSPGAPLVKSQDQPDASSSEVVTGSTSNKIKKDDSPKVPYRHRKSTAGYNALISEWNQAKDSMVNRYFVHTNNRGDAIRFSSKLYDLFECSDEWTETECAQQIRMWQRKVATSSIYASADFTGVIEILKSMQEE